MKKNLITSVMLLSLSTVAFAETQVVQLDEVNVFSAYATPVNQNKTASSVTVLTEADFQKRNATYVSDVLKTVPGVAMASSGGRGTLTNIFLRGAETNHAVVVIDGVKVNPVSADAFDFGGLLLSGIERIEVLRGEQSALWGSDAMGGVIYIKTKSGLYKEKPFNIDVDLGTGSKGTYDAAATISGYENGFYYALHGDSHKTKGISALSQNTFSYTGENGAITTVGGATEKDKFHRDNVSLKLGYDVENKGVEVLAAHSTQVGRYDDSLVTEATFDAYARQSDTTFKLGGYLGNEQELFKHSANISHFRSNNDTISGYGNSAYNTKKFNANYQLDVNFDREGSVTQSVSLLTDYQNAAYKSEVYGDKAKKRIEKSAALEYRYFHENDHSLSVSGRYLDNDFYGDEFTGRIALGYRISPNFRTHASVGSAVQTPTISEYFGYTTWTEPNFDLKAEKSRGGDVGLLIETEDHKHSLDVTYFARNVKDLIVYESDPVTWVGKNDNVKGTSQIRGVELAYNSQFTDVLNVFANYTFTRAKNADGVELIRRPKHIANAGIAYQISAPFAVNANLSYVGKRIDNNSARYKMPSYTLVNLGANYKVNQNISVYANLNNVFNKKYENIVGYGQYGRNVYVGLKGAF